MKQLVISLCVVVLAAGVYAQEGQLTLGESVPAFGFEPVIASNRIADPNLNHWVVQWMRYTGGTSFEIAWSNSSNSGADWLAAQGFGATRKDPFLTMVRNVDAGKSAFHLGYFALAGSGADISVHLRRYVPGGALYAEGTPVAEGAGDRPWGAVRGDRIVVVYAGGQLGSSMKSRAGSIETNPNSADFGKVTWDSSVTTIATPTTGLQFVPHPLIARGAVIGATKYFHHIAVQVSEADYDDANIKFRYFRSADGGASWSERTGMGGFNVPMDDGPDGFHYRRDRPMLNYHLTSSDGVFTNKLYFFYTKTQTTSAGAKYSALYCLASYNDGETWNGPFAVYPNGEYFPVTPPNGYGTVPRTTPEDQVPGFYRIGRVWSTVDEAGRVHVVWFDNRLGTWVLGGDPEDPDYLSDRDQWRVYRAKSAVTGTLSFLQKGEISSASSMGGKGIPGSFERWVPPGDFLSCDADGASFMAVWPDTRGFTQDTPNTETKVYIRRIALSGD